MLSALHIERHERQVCRRDPELKVFDQVLGQLCTIRRGSSVYSLVVAPDSGTEKKYAAPSF